MKATNPKHPPVTSVFSNRPFIEQPETTGFPFKKAMRRIAGTGTFTIAPRHRKGGRSTMRKKVTVKK
jgi:hypothetical protein